MAILDCFPFVMGQTRRGLLEGQVKSFTFQNQKCMTEESLIGIFSQSRACSNIFNPERINRN